MTTRDPQAGFAAAAEALYQGDAEAFSALAAQAALAAAPQVDVDHVVRALDLRASQQAALQKLFDDCPEIVSDRDFQILADRYVDAHIENGLSVPDAIAKAGEQLAEKWGLGKHKETARQSERHDADPMAVEDPSAVIAALRKGRPGQSSDDANESPQAGRNEELSDAIAEMARNRMGER